MGLSEASDQAMEMRVKPRSRNTRVIADVELGPTTWTVESHCGVVRIISSRDGCMCALNSVEARRAAGELAQALTTAAWSVDRAAAGGVR